MKPISVAIIGAGLSGLALGIRLTSEGCRVRIFEKNNFPGGSLGTIHDDGFRFNYGAEFVTAPFLFDQLFETAGKKRIEYFKLRDVEPFIQAVYPNGYRFALYTNPEETEKNNIWLNETDREGFRFFYRENLAQFDEVFFDYCAKPVDEASAFSRQNLKMRSLDLNLSAAAYADRIFASPELKQLFGIWPLLGGADPRKGSHLFRLATELLRRWGVSVPEEGMDQLVFSLAKLFSENGGEILFNAEVSEVLVFNKTASGIRLIDGSVYQADAVISAADSVQTYLGLIDSDRTRYGIVEQAKSLPQSFSMFIYHLGLRIPMPETLPLAPMNVLFPANYQRFLDELFVQEQLSDDPLIFLRIPSKTFENAAPPGGQAMTVMIPVPNTSAIDQWDHLSFDYRNRILSNLQKYFQLDLKSNLVVERYSDPFDFEKGLGTFHGQAFSFPPLIRRSGEIRLSNRSKDIRNLYLTGAGAHPGASIPGVLLSAVNAVELIKSDFQP
ncbi:MAG: phytoene desaturase [Chloroflexi bacterium]|nr:phytoene desaturase [Chloroflexota bacterium]